MMHVVFLAMAVFLTAVSTQAQTASYREQEFALADGTLMTYGLSIPRTEEGNDTPRPLVLALHPGGQRTSGYGTWFARTIVQPGIASLNAIVVAPDCPTPRWAEDGADRAVMKLLEKVMQEHKIDRSRVLVVGFSMGGRGTWYFASRHPDLFTAAIPMAASIGDEPAEKLATMPTYVIHSRADSVVPFAPAEKNAKALEKLGKPITFEPLDDLPHFSMGGYVPSLQRAVRWVAERWQTR